MSHALLVLLEQYKVVSHHITDVQVDDPVHQIEADEADREHNAGVLVNITGGHAVQLVDVLPWMDQMLRRRLLIRPTVDCVLQCPTLKVGLGIVHFKPHLLKQI